MPMYRNRLQEIHWGLYLRRNDEVIGCNHVAMAVQVSEQIARLDANPFWMSAGCCSENTNELQKGEARNEGLT